MYVIRNSLIVQSRPSGGTKAAAIEQRRRAHMHAGGWRQLAARHQSAACRACKISARHHQHIAALYGSVREPIGLPQLPQRCAWFQQSVTTRSRCVPSLKKVWLRVMDRATTAMPATTPTQGGQSRCGPQTLSSRPPAPPYYPLPPLLCCSSCLSSLSAPITSLSSTYLATCGRQGHGVRVLGHSSTERWPPGSRQLRARRPAEAARQRAGCKAGQC